jgi:hypothetical protein
MNKKYAFTKQEEQQVKSLPIEVNRRFQMARKMHTDEFLRYVAIPLFGIRSRHNNRTKIYGLCAGSGQP